MFFFNYNLIIETKVKFVRFMNDDPPNFEVKFLTQNSNITEATFDRHEEVVVIDLDCEVNPISKVKTIIIRKS